MTTYLANGFSPSMLQKLPSDVEFKNVDVKEFCQVIANGVLNAIGHQGTADLINSLCGADLKVNRVSIRVNIGDEIYIITLLQRLEEGKVLSKEEIEKMYEEGKLTFIRAKIYGPVMEELW